MRPIIRVVGAGSSHGDDQVGWRLAEGLTGGEAMGLEVAIIAEPLELLDHLDGCAALIVLDACQTGRPPGTVTCLAWPDARLERAEGRSSHGFGLASALALAEAIGRLPSSVLLFTVEVGDCAPGAGLSPEVRHSLPEARRQLQALLRGGPPSISEDVLRESRVVTPPPLSTDHEGAGWRKGAGGAGRPGR